MRVLAAALATASSLVAVESAGAAAASPSERFPVGGAHMYWAFEIGAHFWGERPCGGDVALAWAQLQPGIRAEARWQNPLDPWTRPAGNFDCRITFNTAEAFEWPDLCTTTVHEVGHLLGRRHSHDPASVMHHSAVEPLAICGGEPRVRRAQVRVLRKRCGRAAKARTASARKQRACQRRAALRAARR